MIETEARQDRMKATAQQSQQINRLVSLSGFLESSLALAFLNDRHIA